MSAIQEKPRIQTVLEALTNTQRLTLIGLLNGTDKQPTIRSLINPALQITTDDKGVNFVSLEAKEAKYTGYLLYTSTICSFIAFAPHTQNLTLLDIDLEKQETKICDEFLDIEELRAQVALLDKADLVNGKVPAEQLPSYVDDVVEYADAAHFPEEGEAGKIYVAIDTGNTYRWSGTEYVQIGGSDLSAIVRNFAAPYDSTATYKVGDLVTYNNVYYKCKTSVSVAEAFDSLKWDAVDVYDSLIGKFVRIIDAPSSTTFTDEQIAIFNEGVFINGEFLNLKNPVFFPGAMGYGQGGYHGYVIGGPNTHLGPRFGVWRINKNTKVISIEKEYFYTPTEYGDFIMQISNCDIKQSTKYQGKSVDTIPTVSGSDLYIPVLNSSKFTWQLLVNNFAPEYDPTATYALGTLVLYQGALYECSTAVETPEEWDASHWTATKISSELGMANPMTTQGDIITGGSSGAPGRLAAGSEGDLLKIVSGAPAYSSGLPYATTAPVADNTDGIKIVVLNSEPATKYNGYLYIVLGSNQ